MKKEFFRANAGILIADAAGNVLACTRADVQGDAWQLPQGGIQRGEEPFQAALREAEEEVGIEARHLELIASHPAWLAYELPEGYRSTKTGRGQVQKWFLFRFTGDSAAIRPDGQELSRCRWMTPDELLSLVAPFRRDVYQTVVCAFKPHLSP
jgi:putative (di)nucleoside polyphosphate hydrolase